MDQAAGLRLLMKQMEKELNPGDDTEQKLTRYVAVVSGSNRSGTSSVAVNLATALKGLQLSVLLVDDDYKRRGEDRSGVEGVTEEEGQENASDTVDRTTWVRKAITLRQGVDALHARTALLYAARSDSTSLADSTAALLREASRYDVVLFDTKSIRLSEKLDCLSVFPEVVLVSKPDKNSLTDNYALLKSLCRLNPSITTYLVINQAETEDVARRAVRTLQEMAENFLQHEVHDLACLPHEQALTHHESENELELTWEQTTSLAEGIEQAARMFQNTRHEIADRRTGEELWRKWVLLFGRDAAVEETR